jgi:ectoine hydroxylase-related dioxygenase (phytanoyl-CoA dioxygenase family)
MTHDDAHDDPLLVDVDEEQVAFFAEHGYLVLDRITTDEELDWLRATYDAFAAQRRTGFPDAVFDVAKPYGSLDEPDLGQLLFPERRVTGVQDTLMWRNSKRVAARLLDLPEAAVESWGHLIFKPPVRGLAIPWHQDEGYWEPRLSYHALGAWMPLDDVDVDNGCLWFLPGSHRGGVLPHRHVGDDPAVHLLELVDEIDTSAAVPVPMRAGAVSFHHPRTLHSSRPNTTDRMRRAWANEFQSAPIALDVPADRPWVTEGFQAMTDALSSRR